MSSVRDFLLRWNNNFPFDRTFRKKYNIAFNSKEHRDTNQIDILFDICEDSLMMELVREEKRLRKRYEEYKRTGNFLEEREEDPERISEIFESLDVTKYKSKE
jgi:hypothetical protein